MGPKGRIQPEEQIRKISKQEANKVCVDCRDKVCEYINLKNEHILYYYYYYYNNYYYYYLDACLC